jgi:hypothetical protein
MRSARYQGDAWRMWNLAGAIPEAERFSRVYRGRRELIDHISASKALVDPLPAVHTHAAEGTLRSITDNPREQRGKPGLRPLRGDRHVRSRRIAVEAWSGVTPRGMTAVLDSLPPSAARSAWASTAVRAGLAPRLGAKRLDLPLRGRTFPCRALST